MSPLAENMSRTQPSAFDVERLRRDFPILDQQVHGHPLIYLDNGASSQKPLAVIEAIDHCYRHDYANVHRGVHTLSERATLAFEQARGKVQGFINAAGSEEIIFVRGTTEAINLVAQSYARPRLQPGDEILITEMEHHSNIVPWQLVCEQTGALLRVVPINELGELRLERYAELLNARTKLVALTHISNVLGTVNPVREIIDQAHARGVPVLLDGAQAIPHALIDVQALDCDFYAFSGHKLYGPSGIGVLYGKRALLEKMPPYHGGGEMIRTVSFEKTTYNDLPYKFEAGTPHIAGAIGLGAAIDYLNRVGMTAIAAHEQQLLTYATEALSTVKDLRIIGQARHKASIVSFVIAGVHPHDIATIVDQHGIAVRAGHHCAMPLIKRLGLPATARASFALYNTTEEIDRLVQALEIARKMLT
ncbi:MAG: cysteine sulfinate desulfinase [Gammaproteobacteria bacterium RBG_16_57_12]|nr:MAG: cysteine sulfinate desulfinase [Gammaproteobacteria bacterium RBG_16_57_12]